MNTAGQDWKPLFFPHKRISQVPVGEVRERLIQVFERWGKPGAIRVDNGQPLGDPTRQATPALALWLISMDIDVIWNKPHCPQMNAVVEKMQDTTSRWAEVDKAANVQELHGKLQQALLLQREQYPVERLQGRTRLVAFPALQQNHRPYTVAALDVKRVYDFLSSRLYTRKVSAGGQIEHFGQCHTIAYCLRHQWVQLRLCVDGSAWEVFSDYKLVKKLPADNLSEDCIQNLTVFQRTNNTT